MNTKIILNILAIALINSSLFASTEHIKKLTPSNTIKSITISLPISKINAATKWYRNLLGTVEEVNPAPGVWEFRLSPTTWLQLFETENNSTNISVLRFETSDIQTSHALAVKLGKNVTNIESVPTVVKYFDFQDPYGNALSFYELLSK